MFPVFSFEDASNDLLYIHSKDLFEYLLTPTAPILAFSASALLFAIFEFASILKIRFGFLITELEEFPP